MGDVELDSRNLGVKRWRTTELWAEWAFVMMEAKARIKGV
jgi:hypothetical protein